MSASTLSVTGSLSGSLTAVSSVTCNGSAASFDSSSFSCSVSVTPGQNALVVIAKDIAGNAAGVRLHVTDSMALPAPTSLQITPGNANVLVGATQLFTAIDQLGHPRTDATWTIDNTSVATISTDSSPVLTGVAGGQATLTATVGGVSSQTQLNVLGSGISLPVGSVVWSAPAVGGYPNSQIVPVVAYQNGADIVTIDTSNSVAGGLARSFSASGQQLWPGTLPIDTFGQVAMGDNSGGILISTNSGYADMDGVTGATAWESDLPCWDGTFDHWRCTGGAVGQDGAVYLVYQQDVSDNTYPTGLVRIDPNSGHAVPTVLLPQYASFENSPIVAEDGSVYTQYGVGGNTYVSGYLLRLAPDGTSSAQLLSSSYLDGGSIIPDGQGGVLVAWTVGNWGLCGAGTFFYQVLDTTSGGLYNFFPDPNASWGCYRPSLSMVLGADGTAYATDGDGVTAIWAFDPLTGNVKWTWRPVAGVASISAVNGSGLLVTDYLWEALLLDSQGRSTVLLPTQSAQYNPLVSARGRWYVMPGLNGIAAAQIQFPVSFDSVSPWPGESGGPPNQSQSSIPYFANFIPKDPGPSFNIAAAVTGMKQFLKDQGVHANNQYFPDSFATISSFRDALNGQILQGLGFIGDSALIGREDQSTFSVGLCFYPQSDPTLNCFVKTPDDASSNPDLHYSNIVSLHSNWQTALSLPVNPKIVFIGSCEISDVFKQWWQIDALTPGHVLVVPSNPNATTNLVSALAEWQLIIKYVSGKMNIGEAVDQANLDLVNQNSPGSWMPIGDVHVCVTVACNTSSHKN